MGRYIRLQKLISLSARKLVIYCIYEYTSKPVLLMRDYLGRAIGSESFSLQSGFIKKHLRECGVDVLGTVTKSWSVAEPSRIYESLNIKYELLFFLQ